MKLIDTAVKHVAWPSCAGLMLSFFPFPVGHPVAAPGTLWCSSLSIQRLKYAPQRVKVGRTDQKGITVRQRPPSRPSIHPSLIRPSFQPSERDIAHLLNLHLKREREVRYQTLAAAESASGNSSHFFTSGHTEWAIGNHVFKIMTGVRFWLHRFGANISPQPLVGPYLRSVCM